MQGRRLLERDALFLAVQVRPFLRTKRFAGIGDLCPETNWASRDVLTLTGFLT
jgi:hypothetical protein